MLWAVKEHRESGWLRTKEPLNNRCSDSGESFADNNYLLLKVHGNWRIAYNTILSLHDTHLSFLLVLFSVSWHGRLLYPFDKGEGNGK